MKMGLMVATMRPFHGEAYDTDFNNVVHLNDSLSGPGDISLAWANATITNNVHVKYNTAEQNDGVVKSYQKLYEQTDEEILCYMHDDVVVRERGWDERLIREFDDPQVGLVGMGGARGHGTPDLYKRPYVIQNLRRMDYASNVDDAEIHGNRLTEEMNAAVLDGYCLVFRRKLLDRCGGWKWCIDNGIDFIGYDYVACCLAHRMGYKIRVVGCRCHHRGGSTSTVANIDRQEEYDRSHKLIYSEFKDVLPWVCK